MCGRNTETKYGCFGLNAASVFLLVIFFFSNPAHELGKIVVAADSFAALCAVVLAKKVLRSASLPRRLLLSAAPSSFFIVQIIACSFSVNYSTCRHTDFLFNNN